MFITFSADSRAQVVGELEGVLDSDAGRDPHLLELGEGPRLSDGDHQLLVVPVPGEEVQEPDPEVTHQPPVFSPARPRLDGLPDIMYIVIPKSPSQVLMYLTCLSRTRRSSRPPCSLACRRWGGAPAARAAQAETLSAEEIQGRVTLHQTRLELAVTCR